MLCWAALAVGLWASAQTPPVLDIQLYAGLTITGAVGTVTSVAFSPDGNLMATSGSDGAAMLWLAPKFADMTASNKTKPNRN